MPNSNDLIEAALAIRAHSYSPYSGFRVGAAVLDETGRIFIGTNVENLSFGATICAERVAVATMVTHNGRAIREVCVASEGGVKPCGMCLQVLAEFAEPGTPVHCAGTDGTVQTFDLGELIPHAFKSDLVNRAEQA